MKLSLFLKRVFPLCEQVINIVSSAHVIPIQIEAHVLLVAHLMWSVYRKKLWYCIVQYVKCYPDGWKMDLILSISEQGLEFTVWLKLKFVLRMANSIFSVLMLNSDIFTIFSSYQIFSHVCLFLGYGQGVKYENNIGEQGERTKFRDLH